MNRGTKCCKSFHFAGFAAIAATLLLAARSEATAQDAAAAEQAKSIPLARFLTVASPVDDVVFGRVKNTALSLQNQAAMQNRRAFLVLEITSGTSQFHQVHGLAKFLTSAELSNVTTIAWVPETVTGNNVVLALAANEILIHPDAELGDIGRGKALDPDERQLVLSLVEKRHNPKLSPALVHGMADPQKAVLKIKQQVDGEDGTTESRVVTEEELERLRESNAIILDVETIKEAGVAGLFSGSEARALDVLAVQTVENRAEIADLYDLPRESLREDPTYGETPEVRLIKIDDMIEPILETFVERQIERTVSEGANLLVFEIESPGGLLLSSQQLASRISGLDPKEVRTVAYIPKQALSGAAIIALGCDEIYMHPNAKIGDAGPIEMKEGGAFERAPEKIVSVLRESLKELAERNNRPPAVAMAMADKDLKVFEVTHRETGRVWYMTEAEIENSGGEWIKGPMVPESAENLLLTLDGRRAHALKIAEPPVEDVDDLRQRLGISPDVELLAAGRTWVDTLVFTLNHPFAVFLLVVIGVVCIYLELHFMTGLLGIISALCISLFFWSKFLGGTAGWLELVLFFLGIVCIGLEVFVIPGFGVFGVSGGLLIVVSMVMASQTFGDIGRQSDIERMSTTLGTLSAAIIVVVALAVLMNRYLPRMPVFSQMVLTPPGLAEASAADEPRLRPEYLRDETQPYGVDLQSLLGEEGVAVSVLRPAGKAQIGGRYVDVVSDGPYIQRGSRIEVVEVAGNRVVVREA